MAGEGLEVGSVWVSVVPRLDKNFTKLLEQQLNGAGLNGAGARLGQQLGTSLSRGLAQGLNGSASSAAAKGAVAKMYATLTQELKVGNDGLARAFQQGAGIAGRGGQLMLMEIRKMLVAMGREPAEVTAIMNRLVLAWRQGGAAQLEALQMIHRQILEEFNRYNSALQRAAATSAATARSAGAGPVGGSSKGRGSYFGGAFGALGAFLIPIAPAVGMAALVGGPWIAAASLAGIGLAQAVRTGFEAGMRQQQVTIQFDTLFGEASEELQAAVAKFAQETPFQLQQLQTSFSGLAAAGLDVEKILPTLRGLGDTLSAMGMATTEGLDRAQYAIKQIIAAGVLRGTEVRQLTELNIPIVQELAAQLDKTTGEVTDLISEGKISSDVLVRAFTNPVGPLKQFSGLMEKANGTFAVALSNFKDAIFLSFGKAFLPILEQVTGWLQKITPAMAPLGEAIADLLLPFTRVLKQTAPLLQSLIATVSPILQALGKALAPLFDALVRLGPVIASALGVLLKPFIALLADLSPIVGQFLAVLGQMLAPIAQLGAILIQAFSPLLIQIARSLLTILQQLQPVFTLIANTLARNWMTIMPAIVQALMAIVDVITQLVIAVLPSFLPLLKVWADVTGLLAPVIAAVAPLLQILLLPMQLMIPILSALTPAIEFLADLLGRALAAGAYFAIQSLAFLVDGLRRVLGAINAVIQRTPGIPQSFKDNMNAAVDAVGDSAADLHAAADQAGNAVLNGFAAYQSPMYAVGYNMGAAVGAGIANGLRAMADAIPPKVAAAIGLAGLRSDYVPSIPSVSSGPDYSGTGSSGGSSSGGSSGGSSSSKDKDKPAFDALISLPFIQENQQDALRKSIRQFINEAIRELKKFNKYSAKFARDLRADGREMLAYSRQWTNLGERIEVTKQVADQLKTFGSPTNALLQGYNSASGIQRRSTDLLQQMKTFAANLKKVKKAGASGALIAQILAAGVEDGNRMMTALLAGTDKEDRQAIAGIDRTMKQTARIAEQTGLFAAKAAEQLGTDMAGGIIKGLESQQQRLENTMTRLAKAMTRAVKQELGIKSPSRVFAEIGGDVGDGLAEGIVARRRNVEDALSAVLPRQVRTPSIAGASRGLTRGEPVVHVYLGNELVNDHIDTRIEYRDAETAAAVSAYLR